MLVMNAVLTSWVSDGPGGEGLTRSLSSERVMLLG